MLKQQSDGTGDDVSAVGSEDREASRAPVLHQQEVASDADHAAAQFAGAVALPADGAEEFPVGPEDQHGRRLLLHRVDGTVVGDRQ
ncbi:MAG: hypothetical protein IPG05_14460 [Gemmatimonadetes bacterium]|nr:hypothetical protein [Gemmatimonadota bacterium]